MTVNGRRAPLVTVLLCAAAIVAACGSTAGTAARRPVTVMTPHQPDYCS